MAEIKVNPTRMELKKLKNRLSVARRGHKLLKDKRDELMRQFLDIVKEAKELRKRVVASFEGYNRVAHIRLFNEETIDIVGICINE